MDSPHAAPLVSQSGSHKRYSETLPNDYRIEWQGFDAPWAYPRAEGISIVLLSPLGECVSKREALGALPDDEFENQLAHYRELALTQP